MPFFSPPPTGHGAGPARIDSMGGLPGLDMTLAVMGLSLRKGGQCLLSPDQPEHRPGGFRNPHTLLDRQANSGFRGTIHAATAALLKNRENSGFRGSILAAIAA